MTFVVQVIHFALRLVMLLVIVQAVLSYFMSPFDPIRQRVDRLVAPLLATMPTGGSNYPTSVGRYHFGKVIAFFLAGYTPAWLGSGSRIIPGNVSVASSKMAR